MKELITKKEKEFIESKEGHEFFKEISGAETRAQLYDRRQSLLNPPENVKRWVTWMDKIKKRIKLNNRKKKT